MLVISEKEENRTLINQPQAQSLLKNVSKMKTFYNNQNTLLLFFLSFLNSDFVSNLLRTKYNLYCHSYFLFRYKFIKTIHKIHKTIEIIIYCFFLNYCTYSYIFLHEKNRSLAPSILISDDLN